MHDECAHYALLVCPWLAAPKFSRLEAKHVRKRGNVGERFVLIDHTQIPERPLTFVAVMTIGNKVTAQGMSTNFVPNRPFRKTEFWRHGVQLPLEEGAKLAKEYIDSLPDPT
jgi:hypothetical protein